MAENTNKITLPKLVDLIKEVEPKMSKTDIKSIISALSYTIAEQVADGKQVSIPDIATFSSILRPARTGINPMTGQKILINDKMIVKCKVNRAFKTKVAKA